jgi:hypothetical protein
MIGRHVTSAAPGPYPERLANAFSQAQGAITVILAMMLISRCALTLIVLGLLALPFTLRSPVSLGIDLLGIVINLALIGLTGITVRLSARRQSAIG